MEEITMTEGEREPWWGMADWRRGRKAMVLK
jgi:hypothetical protein